MNSEQISPLTFKEFKQILNRAQIRHAELSEPIPNMGIENEEKVKACLNNPFQTYNGADLYKGFLHKATILFYSLIKGHALLNGNKRMAILSLMFFCFKNGRVSLFTDDEIYSFSKKVAGSTNPDNAKKYIYYIFSEKIKCKNRFSDLTIERRRKRMFFKAEKNHFRMVMQKPGK